MAENMSGGAPPTLAGSPSRPKIVALSSTLPAADFTSASRRTRSSQRSLNGWSSTSSESIGLLAEIVTSVPAFPCSKILSNEALIVSVNTYVPEIIITPSSTASAVKAARSFRAPSPRNVNLVKGLS